jgi:hypothetical protein
MLVPVMAADSGRNAPKTSGVGGRGGHFYQNQSTSSAEKMCCDGFGKVLSDEHVKQFES